MFTWPDGRPIGPDWFTHRFLHLVVASGLPHLAAHTDLRVVQDMLGHTSYAFTADTDSAVLPEVAHQAAEATAHLVLTALGPALRQWEVRTTRACQHR